MVSCGRILSFVGRIGHIYFVSIFCLYFFGKIDFDEISTAVGGDIVRKLLHFISVIRLHKSYQLHIPATNFHFLI